jgi:hypothetical protein
MVGSTLALTLALGCSGGDEVSESASAPASETVSGSVSASGSGSSSGSGSATGSASASGSEAPAGSATAASTGADKVAALREARALARAGRFDEAWARLSPLLEDGAGAPPFQCEAGYVAFRAGHVEAALPLVRAAADAYPVPEDREGRAALARCLYNVGLVSEAAGDVSAAVSAYQRSFSLRANRTVYEHLVQASLRADGAFDVAESERIGAMVRRAIGPSPSFEELAAGLTDFCMAQRYHPQNCAATVDERWSAPVGSGPLLEAARITSITPGTTYLAVRDASGARLVGELVPRYPEVGELRVESARFEELVPPAGLELVLDVVAIAGDSYFGGNDCDSEERGCDGASRRNVTRRRVVCSPAGSELACVAIPTMELQYHAEPFGVSMPCDRPPPALPYGVGWVGDASFDGAGGVSTSARAVTSEGVRCPEWDEPPANEVSLEEDPLEEPPRPPRARASVPFATLAAERELQLDRGFPQAPTPSAPPALAFLRPWSPPRASAADPAPLDALASTIASSCEVEVSNDQPRCCPYGGSCQATVQTRAHSGTDEAAIVAVRCTHADATEPSAAHFSVLTRGTVGGTHRALATVRASVLPETVTPPRITDLRLEDVLATAGLEARLSFAVEYAEPVTDQRTRIEADSRSRTEVEVLCTASAGDVEARCVGLPVSYRGRQLAAGDDGRAAVVAATGYRVSFAAQGEQLVFTTVEGTPPESLTGSRALDGLAPHRMPPWALGEPEAYY